MIKFKYISLVITVLFLYSCSITNSLTEDQSLLVGNSIIINNLSSKIVDKSELEKFIIQRENYNILGIQLGVFLNEYISESFGEEPVIFSKNDVENSLLNIKSYLNNIGFFNSQVKDSIITHNLETEVLYYVTISKQQLISEITFDIKQEDIKNIVFSDSLNSIIKINNPYNSNILNEERDRVNLLLKNKGYYYITKNSITYEVDASSGSVKIKMIIDNNNGENYLKYKISNVNFYINPSDEYIPDYKMTFSDVVKKDKISFYYFNEKYVLSESILIEYNSIFVDSIYNYDAGNLTHKLLSNLCAINTVGMSFSKSGEDSLVCDVFILPRVKQNYKVSFEGVNVSGNVGFEAVLDYSHYNSFQYSNRFNFSLNSALEIVYNENNELDKATQFGGRISYEIPIIYPINFLSSLKSNYVPKTNIDFSLNFKDRPEYNRVRAIVSFGYKWRTSVFSSHNLQIVTINTISMKDISENFYKYVELLNLENSYEDAFISSSSYSFKYNNRTDIKDLDYSNLFFKFESSGNFLNLANIVIKGKKSDDTYRIFDIIYSQYVKFDFEYKKYIELTENHIFASRIGFGIAVPYGNMHSLPVDKQYQAGGFNDIRAWKNRSLGPGGFSMEKSPDDKNQINFFNQMSDIKLIANIEYRFPLFWLFNGAIFIDAGNIWSISHEDSKRKNSKFEFDSFYKQIAIGSGIGIRLDLSILQLVLDYGIKIRDPRSILKNNWVIQDNPIQDLGVFNLGLNYPF